MKVKRDSKKLGSEGKVYLALPLPCFMIIIIEKGKERKFFSTSLSIS
jgi:hypothetical protein